MEVAVKNRQSRDTGDIRHTRQRTKTIQRHRRHWAHKAEDEDKTKTQHNTETLKGEHHGPH